MKKLLCSFMLMLLSLTASAQYVKSLHVWADDGTDVLFNLSPSLKITFDQDNLKITDGAQEFSISLDKVKLNFSTETNSIAAPQVAQKPVLQDGSLVFFGLQKQQVRIFSLDGKLLQTLSVNPHDGQVVLPLANLPKGACIIQAGAYTMKYINSNSAKK